LQYCSALQSRFIVDAASGKDANAASAAASGCLASDTLVTLTNHKQIPIHQLRPSDKMFTADGKTIRTTEMMMMLDKNTFSKGTSNITHRTSIEKQFLFV
jgi:hypothetical protein